MVVLLRQCEDRDGEQEARALIRCTVGRRSEERVRQTQRERERPLIRLQTGTCDTFLPRCSLRNGSGSTYSSARRSVNLTKQKRLFRRKRAPAQCRYLVHVLNVNEFGRQAKRAETKGPQQHRLPAIESNPSNFNCIRIGWPCLTDVLEQQSNDSQHSDPGVV